MGRGDRTMSDYIDGEPFPPETRKPQPKQKAECCVCGKEFEFEPYRWMPKKVPCNECLKDMVIP